jgi:hypothetical protein
LLGDAPTAELQRLSAAFTAPAFAMSTPNRNVLFSAK